MILIQYLYCGFKRCMKCYEEKMMKRVNVAEKISKDGEDESEWSTTWFDSG